nr:phosphate ABC transporter permease subunit PstC [Armatimonadota bacterium]
MAAEIAPGARPEANLCISDRAFNVILYAASGVVLALVVILGYTLAKNSSASLEHFGWRFLISTDWDPVHQHFGALPFVWGTLVTSFIALLLAVPVGVGTAIFLAELAPTAVSRP